MTHVLYLAFTNRFSRRIDKVSRYIADSTGKPSRSNGVFWFARLTECLSTESELPHLQHLCIKIANLFMAPRRVSNWSVIQEIFSYRVQYLFLLHFLYL